MRDAQNRIAQTLLQLLEKKDITDISIGELCEQTQVARTTFYYYYRTLDDAMEDLLVRMLANLKKTDLSGMEFAEEYLRALTWMKNHEKICLNLRVAPKPRSIDFALHDHLDYRLGRLIDGLSADRPVSEQNRKRICDTCVHILVGETIAWLDSGMPGSAEEHLRMMIAVYDGFIEYVLHNLEKHMIL